MLYQVPEGSSTPGKQLLPLWQVNVLPIYAESNYEKKLSDPTAVTRGADWLDLNTFPPAEYALPRTRSLLNTWKSGFAITTSQCSANLCLIKLWIETFWSYFCDEWCWLTRSEYLSACGICSTKNQKAPQHLEIRFCHYDKKCSGHLCWILPWIHTVWSYCSNTRCWLTRSEYLSTCKVCSTKDQKASQHLENLFWHYDKSMFCQFMLNQTMNRDFLILLQWHAMLTD